MSDDKSDTDGLNRRSVLKSTAALGTVPFATQTVGASAAESSVDVEAALRQSSVRTLLGEIPGVEFDTENATVFGSEPSVVTVPANYGKLVVDAPSAAVDEASASFYFDRHVAGVRTDWPKGTTARLTTTGDETLFERGTTDQEKRAVLQALGRTEFSLDGTSVSLSPDQETVSITNVDRTERVVSVVEASGTVTEDSQATSVEVVDETIYTESDLKSELSTQAECSSSLMIDLVWCIIDYSDCLLCTVGSPAPPVFAACIVIVCYDAGLSFVVEKLADFGCSAALTGGVDCLQQLVDEYGDQIPV